MFHRFRREAVTAELPEKFTFPFYYEPHPLAVQAAEELMHYLGTQQDFVHNFGLDPQIDGLAIGKMFGVLVVQDESGEVGYLRAFSGKLANANHHRNFVPPVFDMLTDGSFFLIGEKEVHKLTLDIEAFEASAEVTEANALVSKLENDYAVELKSLKEQIKSAKKLRDEVRKQAGLLSETERIETLERLRQESIREQYFLKDFQRNAKDKMAGAKLAAETVQAEIECKKEHRRSQSNALQQRLFEQYHFLDSNGNEKSLLEIFVNGLNIAPPAGAGECAAPKLLQYAFLNNLKPIALAEFWWGASPASEVRKHSYYYPACRGKCEPILTHMLNGMAVDDNPLLEQSGKESAIDLVYEDEFIAVINKPAEFLSVPGITLKDSILTRMQERYPSATGPLIVHRLDMSTSGVMVIAKTEKAYRHLQRQFIRRTVRKRYVALLNGCVSNDSGDIDLPLRVDLDDRPRQLVCYEHGKRAVTHFEVTERKNGRTKVHFYPVTGRTHQLRVHASHSLGLGAPIVGDDLYGTKENRLHLHAEWLEIAHPATGERTIFEVPAPF